MFDCHLNRLCDRENTTVPTFVAKVIEAIEKRGELKYWFAVVTIHSFFPRKWGEEFVMHKINELINDKRTAADRHHCSFVMLNCETQLTRSNRKHRCGNESRDYHQTHCCEIGIRIRNLFNNRKAKECQVYYEMEQAHTTVPLSLSLLFKFLRFRLCKFIPIPIQQVHPTTSSSQYNKFIPI